MKTPEHIQQLMVRHILSDLSEQEELDLAAWRGSSPGNEQLFGKAADRGKLGSVINRMNAGEDRVIKKIQTEYPDWNPASEVNHSRTYRMLRIAAIVIVSLGVTLYLLFGIDVGSVPDKKDQKSGNQALFINAEGISIALNDIQRGFRDGYTSKPSSETGGIPVFYAINDPEESKGKYNTLRTLKGGRICLELPEGTRVWLNELSSVTYPANYSVDSEKISVEGEVYVELTENKNAYTAFHVMLGNIRFGVTEGRFNALAYGGDSVIITAIDGKLLLDTGQSAFPLLLNPREQVLIIKGKINRQQHPDIHKVIAWKNRE